MFHLDLGLIITSRNSINNIDLTSLSITARLSIECVFIAFGHLHASLLINAGVDVATVSADLGHSNSNTTLGIYTHEFQKAQAKASNVIENALNFQSKKEPAAV